MPTKGPNPKVLVTGSEPYAGLNRNPAADVAQLLAGQKVRSVTVAASIMPAWYEELSNQIRATISDVQPDVILSLGLDPGTPVIKVETVAINVVDFDVADNHGALVRGARIEPEGPPARHATYPAEAIVKAMQVKGFPARISHHAGTHLCNLTLYTCLAVHEDQGRAVPCGFIHLPLLPEQVADMMMARDGVPDTMPFRSTDLPSMPLETQAAAIRIAIEVMVGS